MPSSSLSLLDTRHLSSRDILSLFEKADQLDHSRKAHGHFRSLNSAPISTPKVIGCLFFEPSTRTRMSFQMAAYRLGHEVLAMETNSSSSLSKGETYGDTVLNIAAMGPDVLVVRYGQSEELDQLLPTLPMPVISGGTGTSSHPTQGLLDAYTIQKEYGPLERRKVLIVGDIKHSRVAHSNFDVLSKLGCEIGICGPVELIPTAGLPKNTRVFENLDEATEWADVYMGLRIQLERHTIAATDLDDYRHEYHDRFGLNPSRLKMLKKDAIIMHPGPINHGVEFSVDVMSDPRNRVLKQVSNGVLIRASILDSLLSKAVADV